MTPNHSLRLTLLMEPLAICRLAMNAALPDWTTGATTFLSMTRTHTELSIVADERAMPAGLDAARGYRALRVEGPLSLGLVGVFASLAAPLAAAGIPIFPVATYDTDYLLVRDSELEAAIEVLGDAGHLIARAT
ncbi:MAG: ACT domain-containing protein [Gemmatimonadaceae bacterium]